MASSSKDADIEGAKKPLIPSENKPQEDSIYRQLFLGSVVVSPNILSGMALGYSAVTLPQLNYALDDSSWFASIVFLGVAVGCFLVNPVMDKFGRKPTLIVSSVIGLIGWLFLSIRAGPPTLAKLYIGRFITGLSAGMTAGPAAAYASECLSVENDKLRTILITWSTVALSVGILFSYVMGSLLAYYKVASLACLISILAFIMVAIFIPESPAWLESKGRSGDAEWAQKQLNIKVPAKPSAESSAQPSTPTEAAQKLSMADSIREFKKPEVYKPLLIMIFFFFFQQFSGVYVLIAYMVDVTRLAGVVILNPYFITIVGGTLMLIVSIGASFVYPKTSVRAIACLSGAGMAVSMFFIAIYLNIRGSWLIGPTYSFTNFIPLTAFLFNIVCSTIGFLILPWSMMNEVFPLHVKGLATGLTTSLGFVFSFFAIKMFPYLSISLGRSETFYFFGLMSLLGTLFVYAFLPETRGKTLEEVLESWSKKKPSGQENV
ncbi:facilitated trehalose transporter Tret1-2 homolog isoform X2 [Macrosteles quadrilineatus]|uniref:facilitated trehalose transporter Tret1-2 homolog isoform X2 n=1 Tax=Macrosteles quadrilineatus TaxID=74068 RepID=UPI0023E2BCB1|nr:facilitated trehalose transporter Tret1-2 homolog isoform X2 [Macrosteles quadrilineatus]